MGFWSGLGNGVRNMVMKLLRIQPAQSQQIVIREPLSYETNVLRNRLWYRGDASELDQFYKQLGTDSVGKSRFWAAVPSDNLQIRKIHSGLPAMIVDRLSDIVIADFDGIEFEADDQTKLWGEISEDNEFPELLASTISEALITGDGSFKITIDTDVTKFPIIEFYSAEHVVYKYNRSRLQEVVFFTDYRHKDKDYRLEEVFGFGYIRSRLLDSDNKEVSLTSLPETEKLAPEIRYKGDFIMAVPLKFFKSPKWPSRGKSVF